MLVLASRKTEHDAQHQVLKASAGWVARRHPTRGPLWISAVPLIRHEWSNKGNESTHTRTVRSCENTMKRTRTMECDVEENMKRSNTQERVGNVPAF